MQVGITGHQKRNGADWSWVETTLRDELQKLPDVTRALSSLAVGSDRIFARVAMSLGIPVLAVIPMEGYERFFTGDSRAEYGQLFGRCQVKNLMWTGENEAGFFAAGKFVADNSDSLFAVWDGEKSKGLGARLMSLITRANCPRK